MIKYLFNGVYKNCSEEINYLNTLNPELLPRYEQIINTQEFLKVTYTKAIETLFKAQNKGHKFIIPVVDGMDLKSEHERYLVEEVYKSPIFLTHFPKDIKAFYMKLDNDDKHVLAFDLLMPQIGEIIGGSQREDSYEKLTKRMEELKIVSEELS
jgi:asparaginyl-tRNA synthetase